MIHDVAIVGAGPSGAFLAHLLAKSGRDVVVVDKHAFPRDKVCGGGISHKTLKLLSHELDMTPVIEHRVTGALIAYLNQDVVEKVLHDREGASVLRSEFDNLLVEHAIRSGARFIPRCAFEDVTDHGDILTIRTSTGTITARHLVGADGVFSQVRHKVFGPSLVTYAPALEALVYVPESELAKFRARVVFDFGGIANGYGWIFPKRDHLNVGVFSIFKGAHGSLRQRLNRFMSLYSSLQQYDRIEYKGSCIPLRNTRQRYQQGNIWLIGDAAGFAESVFGEGIYFALQSAAIASQALTASGEGESEDQYEAALRRSNMLSDLRFSELNARLVFRFPKTGFYHMARNAFVNNLFAELIAGGIGHKECFVRTVATLPYWMLVRKPVSEPRQIAL